MEAALENVISKLPFAVGRALTFADESVKSELCEIRLRTGVPVALTLPLKTVFLCSSGRVCNVPGEDTLVSSAKEINECFLSLCGHSVYAHAAELKEGYLSVGHGCRAGVCGRFFEGRPAQVFSLNIRIARQVFDCALPLMPYADKGLLIAGPPGSGKTTLLRDAVRLLSQRRIRTCVIDVRREIADGFKLGEFCDVIIHKDKAQGAQIAIELCRRRS